MSEEIPTREAMADLRNILGASARLWADGGRHEVEPGWWLAFSGAKSVDYNVILCHGPDGARDLARSLEAVREASVPAVIMVAGTALGMTNLLSNEGWVCVDTKPFVIISDLPTAIDPDVRMLRPEELPVAHDMLAEVYEIGRPFAETALPSVSADSPTREAWGLFEGDRLVSCVGAIIIEDTNVMWSLATPKDLRRQGYGRRLISTVLAVHRERGVTRALGYASPPGISMYESLGYRVLEYWQVWSRARWVFPPA